MRAIGIPGQRFSDQIINRYVDSKLGVPETSGDLEKTAAKKTAESCDCPEGCKCACNCHKSASVHCPQCGGPMAVKGNMERCACGYAQATHAATVKTAEKKKASETSVEEYYKKIYPDDYANELTGKPDSGKAGDAVEYGTVPLDKPVGDVGVHAAGRVTAREVLAFGEEQEGIPPAGQCEVKDSKPTPKSEKPNGSVNEAGDAKTQSGDSANSVGGPNDIPKGEKPNGSANEAGDVKTPDLGVPKGAKGMISREVVAKFCPECADEMKRAGVRAISASFIAKSIAARAKQARGNSK